MISALYRNTATQVEENFNNKLFNSFIKNPTAVFLDLGCADGTITKKISEIIQTKNIYGVEIVATLKTQAEQKGIQVKQFDLNKKFDFPDTMFDVIFTNQTIEHLLDIDNFISEIYRVLKPGGYAVIGTVNIASWHNIFSLIMGWQPFDYTNIITKKWRIGNPISIYGDNTNYNSNLHVKPFTIKALQELCTLYGFKTEEIITSGYYPLPYPLFRLFESMDKAHSAFIALQIRKTQ